MNKKLLIVIPAVTLFASCATLEVGSIPGCHSPPEPTSCTGSRNKLTINTEAAHLNAKPPMVCAKKGTTIDVTITPNVKGSEVTVVVVPKDSDDGWINSNNFKDSGSMKIKVPDDADKKKYDYVIIASNGKCLDPMIHVDR